MSGLRRGLLTDTLFIPGKATGPVTKGSVRPNSRLLNILIGISGGDRGTNASGDVLTHTSDGRPINDLWNEFQASLEFYNEKRQRLLDLLSFSVSGPTENVPVFSGEEEFQRASEFGEPTGIRSGMTTHQLGFDFTWFDLAIRYTWMYLAEASAAQVQSLNAMALDADTRLQFRKVMEAIFRNVGRTGIVNNQSINVSPFYNGDGLVPPPWKNFTHDGTHNHYLTSGAATVDSGDLDAIISHLRHHGYGDTEGADITILANDQEIATMRGFRVASGDSYDFVPPTGIQYPRYVTPNSEVADGRPPETYQGFQVAGQYGPALVLEESYIPASYMFGFATGGGNQATNPVGIREHVQPGLRGLRLVKGRDNDYPLIDSFYQRGFGTGVRHRGAGVVMQVTVAGAYSIPNAYSTVA